MPGRTMFITSCEAVMPTSFNPEEKHILCSDNPEIAVPSAADPGHTIHRDIAVSFAFACKSLFLCVLFTPT
jgi:hypothetical protein